MVFGSGVLVRSLMPANLVDEFVLLTHPLVLGSGRRLFANSGSNLSAFQLVDSATTGTGVTKPPTSLLEVDRASLPRTSSHRTLMSTLAVRFPRSDPS